MGAWAYVSGLHTQLHTAQPHQEATLQDRRLLDRGAGVAVVSTGQPGCGPPEGPSPGRQL